MPLYEFVCQACGRPFERLLSFSKAEQGQICPTCGSAQTARKLSSFAVGGASQSKVSARPASSPFT